MTTTLLTALLIAACPQDTIVIDIHGISDAHMIFPYAKRDTVGHVARIAGRWDIRKCGKVQLPISSHAYQVMEVHGDEQLRQLPSDSLLVGFIRSVLDLRKGE